MKYILFKNQLYAKDGDPLFVARSRITKRLRKEQVIEKIAYGCTLTEADIGAVLTSLEKTLVEYVALGFSIELGFLSLAYSIKGGFESEEDIFHKDRNWIAINAAIGKSFLKAVNQKAEPEKVISYGSAPKPLKIFKVSGDIESPEFLSGNLIRITGAQLSFDQKDEESGVFLLSENGPVRVSEYSKIGGKSIDLKMPDGLTAGDNHVEVRTRKADGSIIKGVMEAPILIAA